jgi:hypothetical protein
LSESLASVKSIGTESAPGIERAADIDFGFGDQIDEEGLAQIAGKGIGRVEKAQG